MKSRLVSFVIYFDLSPVLFFSGMENKHEELLFNELRGEWRSGSVAMTTDSFKAFLGIVRIEVTLFYYMTSPVSGQDEPNLAL